MDFIKKSHLESGMAPTIREICARFGLKSPSGVHRILHALEAKGYLVSTPGKKRAWRLAAGPARPSMPLIGRIAAGFPIDVEENKEEDIPFDPLFFGSEECFCLRIEGDSMIDANIADGDIAVVRPQENAEDGEIVAVMVENILPEATLKVLKKKDSTLELHPANSRYPPLIFKGEELSKVRIVGKLVGIIRRS